MGALIIPPRPRFQITKHFNLDILVLECYLLGSLKYKRTYTFENYKTQLGIVKKYFWKSESCSYTVLIVLVYLFQYNFWVLFWKRLLWVFWYFCVLVMKRFLVVRSGFFERHGWVMKEATIFSWARLSRGRFRTDGQTIERWPRGRPWLGRTIASFVKLSGVKQGASARTRIK
jgi:hypothetical protein